MTREDLRVKLQVLLSEFSNEHHLSDDEIYTISFTLSSLMYSDQSTRLLWYKEMSKVADIISKSLHDEAEQLMDKLNMTSEERAAFKKRIEAAFKNSKVEN